MRVLSLLLALSLFASPALAQGITGPARVIDGDILDIAGHRIRLHGIDEPEKNQTCQIAGVPWEPNELMKRLIAVGCQFAPGLTDQSVSNVVKLPSGGYRLTFNRARRSSRSRGSSGETVSLFNRATLIPRSSPAFYWLSKGA